MAKPSDHAVHFEALKLRIGQVKEGITLVLLLKTDETPPEIWKTPINQRYMVALVPIGDDEQPVVVREKTPEEKEAAELVRYAALLCKDETFQRWMYRKGYAAYANEDQATRGLRKYLGVESRAEIATDPGAMENFELLTATYRKEVGIE